MFIRIAEDLMGFSLGNLVPSSVLGLFLITSPPLHFPYPLFLEYYRYYSNVGASDLP